MSRFAPRLRRELAAQVGSGPVDDGLGVRCADVRYGVNGRHDLTASFARFKVGADRLAQLLLGLVVQHHTVVVEMLKVSAPRRTVHV